MAKFTGQVTSSYVKGPAFPNIVVMTVTIHFSEELISNADNTVQLQAGVTKEIDISQTDTEIEAMLRQAVADEMTSAWSGGPYLPSDVRGCKL